MRLRKTYDFEHRVYLMEGTWLLKVKVYMYTYNLTYKYYKLPWRMYTHIPTWIIYLFLEEKRKITILSSYTIIKFLFFILVIRWYVLFVYYDYFVIFSYDTNAPIFVLDLHRDIANRACERYFLYSQFFIFSAVFFSREEKLSENCNKKRVNLSACRILTKSWISIFLHWSFKSNNTKNFFKNIFTSYIKNIEKIK